MKSGMSFDNGTAQPNSIDIQVMTCGLVNVFNLDPPEQ